MKLVFNLKETAESLGKTAPEFEALLPGLYGQGFPQPVPGLGQSWSVMQLIRWVNGEGSAMMAAHLLADDEEDSPALGGRH